MPASLLVGTQRVEMKTRQEHTFASIWESVTHHYSFPLRKVPPNFLVGILTQDFIQVTVRRHLAMLTS